MDDGQGTYKGAETTGFQSPAQDHIEHVIDLARVLDLRQPGIYPVRVSGQAFAERGIREGDILIANTAAQPVHGKVAVAVLQGSFRLATLERRAGHWFLLPSARRKPCRLATMPRSGRSSAGWCARPSDGHLWLLRCEKLLLFV